MKKSMLMIAVLAMSALAMVSCKKDNDGNNGNGITTIFAKMDGSKTGGEKTHLGGTNEGGQTPTLWSTGDKVGVFTATGTPIEYTLAGGANTSSATFSGDELSGETPYCAFYPYYNEGLTASKDGNSYTVTFTLPATQTYQAPKGGNPTFAEATAPMIAYSTDGSNYTFKNVMGTLKVDLKGTGKVGKLVLIDNNSEAKLYGTATVSVPDETDEPTATIENGGNTLTLDCGGGVTLFEEAATSFYFVVPVGTLGTKGFKIDVYDIAGTKKATVDKSNAIGDIIRRNVISTTRENVGEVSVRGLFQINSEGAKVYFSQGNLQYCATGSTSTAGSGSNVGGTWRFADHQWDYVGDGTHGTVSGSNNANIGQTYEGWIDLFGWGTSGWNNGNSYFLPYDTQKSDYSSKGYGYGPTNGTLYNFNLTDNYAKADWGVNNAISNGGGSSWRTLTEAEWMYLISNRTVNGDKGEGYSYQRATINSVYGMILYPDNYTKQASYATTDWATMEAAGCVFLPAAGYRNNNKCFEVGSSSRYWSSSSSGNDKASSLYFAENIITVDPHSGLQRYMGASVRLVTNVPAVP